MSYANFLKSKTHTGEDCGFDPLFMPDFLYPFQRRLLEWSVRKGRSAIFADCGLGKTPIQLSWAQNVVEKTNGRVLVLTPLAVSHQTKREADKFGIAAEVCKDSSRLAKITVTNYEKLAHFDPSDFVGVVCDESSMLKAMNGKRRRMVTHFVRDIPFRLLCTATAAPNDYIELGTHSEALGNLGQIDMLNSFFKSSDDATHIWNKAGDFWTKHKWLFKAHAEEKFWKWVCTWAVAIKKPSDFGCADDGFTLPPLNVEQHVVDVTTPLDGELFPRVATTLSEQRQERKKTIVERCEKVAELLDGAPVAVAWCHGNDESALLAQVIDGASEVKGAMSDDEKEERLAAFSNGETRVLVTKPTIAGFGMNWQHCNNTTFFPSHSFEQYYQAVRRFWRFGQANPVNVHIVTTPGEAGVTANLNRKAEQADKMFSRLVELMDQSKKVERLTTFSQKQEKPKWL